MNLGEEVAIRSSSELRRSVERSAKLEVKEFLEDILKNKRNRSSEENENDFNYIYTVFKSEIYPAYVGKKFPDECSLGIFWEEISGKFMHKMGDPELFFLSHYCPDSALDFVKELFKKYLEKEHSGEVQYSSIKNLRNLLITLE